MVLKSAIRLYTAKRIPLIRFRAGQHDDPSSHAATSASINPVAKKSVQSSSTGQTIEDWQLPPRYQRKPIDQAEIEFINRGGPA